MNEGTVAATFVIMFREALEASLIVGIIMTALSRMGQSRYFPHVVGSAVAAIFVSILAGFGLMQLTESAQGNMEKVIEGIISIVACSVLTYMVFWMMKQSQKIKSDLEVRVESAVTKGEFFAIVSLPFLSVFREGAETVLYLKAVAIQSSGAVSFWGGFWGLFLAVAIASAIFIGGKRIPLQPFFKYTGFFILVIAAGLLAYGIHELQELGWIPTVVYPVWNINSILNEKEGIGAFLKALFGYNGNPSLIEIVAYASYLILIPLYLLRGKKPALVATA
jgi:high-affinity iron transporter